MQPLTGLPKRTPIRSSWHNLLRAPFESPGIKLFHKMDRHSPVRGGLFIVPAQAIDKAPSGVACQWEQAETEAAHFIRCCRHPRDEGAKKMHSKSEMRAFIYFHRLTELFFGLPDSVAGNMLALVKTTALLAAGCKTQIPPLPPRPKLDRTATK
jgi:hypothetical protein